MYELCTYVQTYPHTRFLCKGRPLKILHWFPPAQRHKQGPGNLAASSHTTPPAFSLSTPPQGRLSTIEPFQSLANAMLSLAPPRFLTNIFFPLLCT